MQAAARVAEAMARWRAVSKETEAGSGSDQDMTDRTKIIGWTNVGTEARIGPEWARDYRANKIGWTRRVWGGGALA